MAAIRDDKAEVFRKLGILIIAAGLLKDWKHTVARFTHVVPEHYLAMTAAMAKAEEDNIDFNTPGAWEQVYEQVMEGAH